MTRRIVWLAMVGLALAAFPFIPCRPLGAATTLPQAPNVTLTLLDGKPLALTDLKGKPVLINFWRAG